MKHTCDWLVRDGWEPSGGSWNLLTFRKKELHHQVRARRALKRPSGSRRDCSHHVRGVRRRTQSDGEKDSFISTICRFFQLLVCFYCSSLGSETNGAFHQIKEVLLPVLAGLSPSFTRSSAVDLHPVFPLRFLHVPV